jgi:3-oxoacyl-[acyl-carrier protein] reductase
MSDINNQRVALITGGTKGFGKEIALKFAEHGDNVVITYNWGSVEDADLLDEFMERNLPKPLLIQANVVSEDDTRYLMDEIKRHYGKVDIFISNVSFSSLVRDIDDYNENSLYKSIEYSTWPMIAYIKQIKKTFGNYPKYVLGLSSHGPDTYHVNYDFAAATKAISEVLVKYLNYRFFDENIIFNMVRTRPIITDSLLSTSGQEWLAFIEKYDIPDTAIELEEIAKVVFMMCSGLMDGIRGQTINADRGYDFADGLQRLYQNHKELGL